MVDWCSISQWSIIYTWSFTYLSCVESENIRGESDTNIALGLFRIMHKPYLKGNPSLVAEVNALNHFVLFPIPYMKVAAILPCKHITVFTLILLLHHQMDTLVDDNGIVYTKEITSGCVV